MKTGLTITFIAVLATLASAQVGINTDGSPPHSGCHVGRFIYFFGLSSTKNDHSRTQCHYKPSSRPCDIQYYYQLYEYVHRDIMEAILLRM